MNKNLNKSLNKNLINYFKNFSKHFPNYFRIKNPNFFIMMRYYLKKTTFRYLLILFFRNPFRVIFNLLIFIGLYIKNIILKNRRDVYIDNNIRKIVKDFSKGRGFVTISYCQKPFFCPDGRFSYKCTAAYDVCNKCFLKEIKIRCDILNLDYYIVLGDLDSVWNILRNQYDKYYYASYVLTTCSMVSNVVKYISPLFGFRGIILSFSYGACNTLFAYELSEFGYKNVVTDLSDNNKKILISILNKAVELKLNNSNTNQIINRNINDKINLVTIKDINY